MISTSIDQVIRPSSPSHLDDVGVIVVIFHSGPQTVHVLSALREEGIPFKNMVVVDNGSPDVDRNLIKALDGVHLVTTGANPGFAAAVNAGALLLADRGLRATLVLNPDVEIRPGSVQLMSAALESASDAWAAGPCQSYHGSLIRRDSLEKISGRFDIVKPEVRTVGRLSGHCMLVRQAILTDTVPLDPEYFLYREDDDFSCRVRDLGGVLIEVCNARVFHRISQGSTAPSGARLYYSTRGTLLLLRKHTTSRLQRLRNLPYCLTRVGRDLIAALAWGGAWFDSTRVVIRGVMDGLTNPFKRYHSTGQSEPPSQKS